MNHEILNDITFFFDKLRITFGNSECPLYQKCPQREEDNDCCVSFRGRMETGGDRVPCYFSNKKWIRNSKKVNKIGVLGRIFRPILNLLVSIGGERENGNTDN